MPAGALNGNRTQGRKLGLIIGALSDGMTDSAVSRQFKMSRQTIAVIRKNNLSTIEQGKLANANRAQLIAEESSAQMLDELVRLRGTKKRLHPTALVPIYGVAIDKMLALRGDTPIQRHEHIHVNADDLIAFAVSRSQKQATGHEITNGQ